MAQEHTLREWPPYSAGLSHSEASGRGIVDGLLLLGVLAQLCLSGFALSYFGLPYDAPGGSIITKIHPATYLFLAGLCLAVIASRDPLVYLASLASRCIGSALLILACAYVWVFISRVKGDQPASFLIDAMMTAAFILMLFTDAGEGTRTLAARIVHVMVVANCCLSIVEGLSGWRLFPYVLGARDQTWEYRATAFFGHPLAGGLATGVYAVILMTVREVRGLSDRWRLPLLALCMAAMPFIGARTSFAVVTVTAAVAAGLGMFRFMRGKRASIGRLVGIMLVVPLVAGAVALMFQLGLFDNFIARFANDNGSAASRFALFGLFTDYSLGNLLVGESDLSLATRARLAGLSEGIENSWAAHALHYGIVVTAVLWLAIAAWFGDMLRAVGRGAILPLAFVLLILSTTVGVSGKTNMLTLSAIIILASVKKQPPLRSFSPASPAFGAA